MGEGSRKQHNDWLYGMLIPSLFIQRNGYVYHIYILSETAILSNVINFSLSIRQALEYFTVPLSL